MTFALAAPVPRSRLALPVVAALLLLVTLAVRAQTFGNPAVHVDEQFYLLAGDRMLHGAIPYVDIWDRKPVGLFLIYAAASLLGRDGILQYQLVAALSVAATAWLIVRISDRIASGGAAIMAGVAYIVWLDLAAGDGGQAAIFFNLPMAAAALLLVRLIEVPAPSVARLRWTGAGAMLLVGCAMQIKYSALFEGVFFGLVLLWATARFGTRHASLVGNGLIWVICALLPTGIAMLAYAMIGHFHDFIFANFLSIGDRRAVSGGDVALGLATLVLILSPLLVGAVVSRPKAGEPETAVAQFSVFWLIVAVAAVLISGTYFTSYCLPIMVPATIAAAPYLDRSEAAQRTGIAVILLALIVGQGVLIATSHAKGDRAGIEAMAAAARGQPGCLFVYDGHPILYYLSGSCLLTRFAFPGHLNQLSEAHAVGVDVVAETRRILALRPGTIATVSPAWHEGNPETARIVDTALHHDYRLIYSVRTGDRVRQLYALRLPAPGVGVR